MPVVCEVSGDDVEMKSWYSDTNRQVLSPNHALQVTTFVVNLDKDRDRWAHVSSVLTKLCLKFERVPAVNGRELTAGERALHYDPITASWRQARDLTPAEIGCALSHLGVYRRISKRNLPHAFVLEDDVSLSPDTPELLNALAPLMGANHARICLLSPAKGKTHLPGEPLGNGYTLQPYESGYFASSYMITRSAAEILLDDLHPVSDVADCWSRLRRLSQLEIFVVTPSLVSQKQASFGSSTTTDIQNALSSPGAQLRYKIFRLRNIMFGRLLEARRRARLRPISANTPHAIDTLER